MHDKRPDIQGLRAWAVISVVIFHFFPSLLPYGYLGVDVFFVLSGFLITLVLEGRPRSLSTYYNFYFKRLRRILPLALLIVLLCVITLGFLQSGFELSNGIKSALYSMFFVKNLQPRRTLEEDYFQALEHANDFFTHFWSLCVEIQFYLLAPFLLHLFKPNLNHTLSSFIFLTVISLGSFSYSLLDNPQDAFDSTLARLWQFLAGAMAFHADLILSGRISISDNEGEKNDAIRSHKRALIVPALFAVVATIAVLYSGEWETVLRFYTTFFISLVLVFRSKSVMLCHESLQLIGDVSYSLYLIHWPIVCILDIFDIQTWQVKSLSMLAALGLSIICHFGFEKRYLTFSTKSTIILVIGLYISTLFAIGASNYVHMEALEKDSVIRPSSQLSSQSNFTLTQAEIDKANAKMARENDLRYKDCKIRDGKNPIGFCELTGGNGSLHFMIMGNSYSANLGGLIQKHFRPHYGKLQARAIAQCEPLVTTPKDHYCPDFRPAHKIFDSDIDKERPDVLFLIARYINPNQEIKRPIEKDPLYQVMENRLKFFEQRVKKKIFILQAFPKAARPGEVEKVMKKKGLPMMPYMPEGVELDAKPLKERVRKLAEKCTKCVIFSIEAPFLNEAGNFTVLNRQKLWYFDGPRHLNILGRQLIEPVFERMAQNFTQLLNSNYPDNII